MRFGKLKIVNEVEECDATPMQIVPDDDLQKNIHIQKFI